MANKNKKNPHRLTAADIALAILAALGGAIAFMTIALVAGSLLFPESWERQTAEEPSARPSYHGTLPSKAPTSTPAPSHTEPLEESSSEPTPEETEEPVQQTSAPTGSPSRAPTPQPTTAPTSAPTRTPTAPSAPTLPPAPAVSIWPIQNTTAPTQSGGANGSVGGQGNANNFYAHDNPGQQQSAAKYVLNTSTMKFHYPTCNDVARISPENYQESNQARAQITANGYSPCGHCDP